METAAVALALCGSSADWPVRFVFKVLEELEDRPKQPPNG
jgi:hypothetical protein